MILLLLAVVLGAPHGTPLSGTALEERTHEVASLLRCPVCQGMSVADSPSTDALDTRRSRSSTTSNSRMASSCCSSRRIPSCGSCRSSCCCSASEL
ncbi:MAG: hypothetical protein DMF59_19820 [Acidobacteria bacterium]|nr:MAG: hypothetical protein DMF59_19820 [Acidobacteriota bacterium]